MKRRDFLEQVKKNNKMLRKVLAGKAIDYAGMDDALSCFDRTATMAYILNIDATKPEGVAFLLMCLKLDRLSNLVFSDKEPSNESINDSFQDLRGYSHLAEAIIAEANDDYAYQEKALTEEESAIIDEWAYPLEYNGTIEFVYPTITQVGGTGDPLPPSGYTVTATYHDNTCKKEEQ